MDFHPVIEGFEGQDITVKSSLITGTRLLLADQKAPKGPHRGTMSLTRNDGRVVVARWIPQMFGFDTPQLEVDGKNFILTQPLKAYEMILSALPIVLVFIGGLLGGIIGILGFGASAAIFRSGLNKGVKVLLSILVIIVAVILYLVLATLFQLAIGR